MASTDALNQENQLPIKSMWIEQIRTAVKKTISRPKSSVDFGDLFELQLKMEDETLKLKGPIANTQRIRTNYPTTELS